MAPKRSTRGAVIVIGLCLLIGVGLGVALMPRLKDELLCVQDLTTGLIYFIEAHGGRMPVSEQEFRESRFVEAQPDGRIRIVANPDSNYRRAPHGYPIGDLAQYRIGWGIDLTSLEVDDYGRVRDGEGKPVVLFKWPSSEGSEKGYSRLLLLVSREVRARAAAP